MSIIRVAANVPVELALKYDNGKQVKSRIPEAPDQMMYTVCGDDTIYVPLSVGEQIAKLGIKKLELFRICKRIQNNVTRWLVERAGESTTTPIQGGGSNFSQLPTAIDATPLERQLTQSIHQAQQRKVPVQGNPSAAVATVSPVQREAPVADLTPNVTGHNRASAVMSGAMVAAIDALIVAQQYGKAKGITLQFNEEDVRTTAATLYIQACKDPLFSERMVTPQKVNGGTSWEQH